VLRRTRCVSSLGSIALVLAGAVTQDGGRGRPGRRSCAAAWGAATRERARAVREVLEEEARADAGAGPAAGGAAGVGQAAAAGMAQAQQGLLATFACMLTSYATYNALTDDEKRAYLQARASFKHPQTELLKDGPGDITVMAKALQAALKVATAITT